MPLNSPTKRIKESFFFDLSRPRVIYLLSVLYLSSRSLLTGLVKETTQPGSCSLLSSALSDSRSEDERVNSGNRSSGVGRHLSSSVAVVAVVVVVVTTAGRRGRGGRDCVGDGVDFDNISDISGPRRVDALTLEQVEGEAKSLVRLTTRDDDVVIGRVSARVEVPVGVDVNVGAIDKVICECVSSAAVSALRGRGLGALGSRVLPVFGGA